MHNVHSEIRCKPKPRTLSSKEPDKEDDVLMASERRNTTG